MSDVAFEDNPGGGLKEYLVPPGRDPEIPNPYADVGLFNFFKMTVRDTASRGTKTWFAAVVTVQEMHRLPNGMFEWQQRSRESVDFMPDESRLFQVPVSSNSRVLVAFLPHFSPFEFRTTQGACTMSMPFADDASDMSRRTRSSATKPVFEVEVAGPSLPNEIVQNIVQASDALTTVYRRFINASMAILSPDGRDVVRMSQKADRENEPAPCWYVTLQRRLIPTAAYFAGYLLELGDTERIDAFLLPWFQLACLHERVEDFDDADVDQQVHILGRMLTLPATTMRYVPDTVESDDGTKEPCNRYESFESMTGDCEEATLFIRHMWEWLLQSGKALESVRSLAKLYRLYAACTRIVSESSRAHHMHGLLIRRSNARGVPPALLLEGTTRTNCLPERRTPTEPLRFPSNDEGERKAIVLPDKTINGFYLDVVALFECDAAEFNDNTWMLRCDPIFPAQRVGGIGVPLSDFMENPRMIRAPPPPRRSTRLGKPVSDSYYTDATKIYAVKVAFSQAPVWDVTASLNPKVTVDALLRNDEQKGRFRQFRIQRLAQGAKPPTNSLFTFRHPEGTVVFV